MPTEQNTAANPPVVHRRTAFVYAFELGAFAVVFALTILASLVPPTPGQTAAVGWPMLVAFFTTFAGAVLLVLYLLRHRKNSRLFGVMLALAVFAGIVSLAETSFGPAAAVLALSGAILLWYGLPLVLIFDLLLTLGIAGLAANMGLAFTPIAASIVVAVLSVYDIVAVYWTGHMVEMGESLLRQKAFFAIIVPTGPSGIWTRLKDVAPGSGHYFIGTGDLVLPAILVAAATRAHPATGLTAAFGALIGLAVTMTLFLSQRRRRPMPALPPIALGAILGYFVGAAFFP